MAFISVFGFHSGAAFVTVMGVLIEVPVTLLVVGVVKAVCTWLETRLAALGSNWWNDHVVDRLSIDPHGVAELGVPADEYSTWAAATLHTYEKGALQEEMAETIKGFFVDWDAGEISDGRAASLAEVFLNR